MKVPDLFDRARRSRAKTPLIAFGAPRCGDFSLARSVYDDLPEHFQRDALSSSADEPYY